MFSQRVSKKDITLERLSATSALFHITKLQDSDDGVYECHSPNPVDEDYLGTYSAKITVKGKDGCNLSGFIVRLRGTMIVSLFSLLCLYHLTVSPDCIT